MHALPGVRLHDVYEGFEDGEPLRAPFPIAQRPRTVSKVDGPWVQGLVDRVAEAHHGFTLAAQVLDVGRDVVHASDVLGHLHDTLGGPSVDRALKGGNPGRDRRVEVRSGGSGDPWPQTPMR